MNSIKTLTEKTKIVMEKYQEAFPDVVVDRDYFPFKTVEECGECLQAFLMLTDRGRQKGKNKKQIKQLMAEELADVLGFLLLFAENEKIDIEKAMEDKWFSHVNNMEMEICKKKK